MSQDFYQVLGVSRQASADEIRKAYKRIAKENHPDRRPGDKAAEEKMKAANQAYDVLSNSKKRASYDQFGEDGMNAGMGGGFQGDVGDIFGDIFGDMFSGGRAGRRQRQSAAQAGADLMYSLSLSLTDAYHGTKKDISFSRLAQCDDCHGTGSRDPKAQQDCPDCGGAGQVRMQHGFITMQQTCSRCQGSGRIVRDPCKSCHGQGRYKKKKTVSVKIPAGVATGDRVRLSGEGEAGVHGGPSGDLYVQVDVAEHPLFQRDGDDIRTELPVSMKTAILGGSVQVPTLDGTVSFTLPEGTQNGRVFRLKGKGMSQVRSSRRGDLLCLISVETPVHLTEEQKGVLSNFFELVEQNQEKHSPKTSTWLDSVKRFFQDKA